MSIRISKNSEGKETVADVKQYSSVYTDVNYREWNVFLLLTAPICLRRAALVYEALVPLPLCSLISNIISFTVRHRLTWASFTLEQASFS